MTSVSKEMTMREDTVVKECMFSALEVGDGVEDGMKVVGVSTRGGTTPFTVHTVRVVFTQPI
jgi:hypothetical protein